MKKRILSIALVLCMLLSVVPLTSFAATATAATAKDIMMGTSAIQDPTEVTNGSRKYYTPNSYIYFGKNGTTPIKWRVLDAYKANDDSTNGMFLLSENVLTSGMLFYQGETKDSNYQGSGAQTWCSNFAANSSNFSTAEQNAMLGIEKTDSEENLYSISWAASGLTTTDNLFFLSAREVFDYLGNYDCALGLAATDTSGISIGWWLRSYTSNRETVGVVIETGYVNNYGFGSTTNGARPALNLNLSSVLFTSAAVGGKTSGNDAADGTTGIFANKNYSDITNSDGYKLTLLDESRINFSACLKSVSGSTATVSYSGAKTGTNEYISVIIKNGDNVKYYGRVVAASAASGNVTFTLPNDFSTANGDVLCVFNEQYNGDKNSDYASDLIDVHIDHCICGEAHSSVGDHTEENKLTGWTAISTGTALAQITASGNYYLSDNVTLSSRWTIANGTNITLCLNGKTLTADNENIGDTITIEGTLTITDCMGSGKITGTNPSNSTDNKNHKVLVISTVYEGCTLNLYGGTITGIHAGQFYGGGVHNEGTFNMYGGTIAGNSAWYGGGVANCYNRRSGYNDKGLAEFNFYGGTISGNTATHDGNGGNDIYNRASSKINANGGEVAGEVESLALITTAEGYTGTSFKGNVNNKGTIDGGIFYGSVSGDGTITDNAKVTVTFTSDNWTDTQKILRGQKAAVPTRNGCSHICCYTDSACNKEFDFDNTAVINNITLYAEWNDIASPVISGIENGKTYCGEVKFKVTDNVGVASVVFGQRMLTIDADGFYTVEAGAGFGQIVAKDAANNSAYCAITVNSNHICNWKNDGTYYWQECSNCDYTTKTDKKAIPNIKINIIGADKVCRTDDYVFSFEIPEGCKSAGGYIDLGKSTETEAVTEKNGVVTITVPASAYKNFDSFTAVATVTLEDGYTIEVSKAVAIQNEHTYEWQTENGQYWQKCKFCNDETAKKDIPTITINGSDKLCYGYDYSFTIVTAEGLSNVKGGYDCIGKWGGPLPVTVENGIYTATAELVDYQAMSDYGENKLTVIAYAETADGYVVSTSKTVEIQESHSGGTATCTEKAKCEVCGEPYGKVNDANHTTLKHIEAKAATTEAEGNIEYWHCEDCDKYFSDKDGKNEIKLSDTVIAKLVKTDDDNKSPQTGDNSHMALWLALLFVSGGALIGAGLYGKNKKRFVK